MTPHPNGTDCGGGLWIQFAPDAPPRTIARERMPLTVSLDDGERARLRAFRAAGGERATSAPSNTVKRLETVEPGRSVAGGALPPGHRYHAGMQAENHERLERGEEIIRRGNAADIERRARERHGR